MLPSPWQISPEQKEDDHKEEHHQPRLQWNSEGDALFLALLKLHCNCWPCPVDLMTLPDKWPCAMPAANNDHTYRDLKIVIDIAD